MLEYFFSANNTDYDFEKDKGFDTTHCTNPLNELEEVKNNSWLDDFGWI